MILINLNLTDGDFLALNTVLYTKSAPVGFSKLIFVSVNISRNFEKFCKPLFIRHHPFTG